MWHDWWHHGTQSWTQSPASLPLEGLGWYLLAQSPSPLITWLVFLAWPAPTLCYISINHLGTHHEPTLSIQYQVWSSEPSMNYRHSYHSGNYKNLAIPIADKGGWRPAKFIITQWGSPNSDLMTWRILPFYLFSDFVSSDWTILTDSGCCHPHTGFSESRHGNLPSDPPLHCVILEKSLNLLRFGFPNCKWKSLTVIPLRAAWSWWFCGKATKSLSRTQFLHL